MWRNLPPSSIQNSAVSLLARAEGVDDLLHLVHARRRVAVLHLAADHAGAAREDALALAVVAHPVVLVDEAEVDGQGAEHEVQLLEREAAGRELEEAGRGRRRGRRGGGRARRARRPRRRRRRRRRSRSRPRRRGSRPTRRSVSVSMGHGEEDLLLLVDHVVGHLRELLGAARGLRRRRPPPRPRRVCLSQSRMSSCSAHITLLGPSTPCSLEVGEELVLLAQVVALDLARTRSSAPCQRRAQGGAIGLRLRRRLGAPRRPCAARPSPAAGPGSRAGRCRRGVPPARGRSRARRGRRRRPARARRRAA